MKAPQQALTGLLKSIRVVFPFSDKPRQKPEPFGNGLGFQDVDLLGEFAQRVYCKVFAGLYHASSPLNQTALDSTQQGTVVNQPLVTVDGLSTFTSPDFCPPPWLHTAAYPRA
jgi:hypothetical protein